MRQLATAGSVKSDTLLRDVMERFLYSLATLLFCTVPFMIPGVSNIEGGVIFFGEFVVLSAGVIAFVTIENKKSILSRSKK